MWGKAHERENTFMDYFQALSLHLLKCLDIVWLLIEELRAGKQRNGLLGHRFPMSKS